MGEYKQSTAAKNKWISDNLDRIYLVLPKGQKQELAEHAAARGESLNKFIARAIDNQLQTDNQKTGE